MLVRGVDGGWWSVAVSLGIGGERWAGRQHAQSRAGGAIGQAVGRYNTAGYRQPQPALIQSSSTHCVHYPPCTRPLTHTLPPLPPTAPLPFPHALSREGEAPAEGAGGGGAADP